MNQQAKAPLETIWSYMHLHMEPQKADCIVGFGNYNLAIAHRAAELYHQGYAPRLLFTGGLGRNTDGRWTGSEAERFAAAAMEDGVPAADILLETRSSNTAENIRFTRQLLAEHGLEVHTLLGVHQQFMERRIYAALGVYWPEVRAIITSPRTTIEEYLRDAAGQGLSRREAIEVMVGDFQRIDVYARRGWQLPQEIPPEVWTAFHALVKLGYTGQLVEPPENR